MLSTNEGDRLFNFSKVNNMDKAKKHFIRYQLPAFFLLSCLLSWWTVPLMNGMIFPYGPLLAALIVSAATAGRQGVSKWWRAGTRWRVSWYWYLVGPAIVIGYQGLAYFLNLLLGASITNPLAFPSIAIILQLLITGGQWEEPGWTGYALPKVLERSTNRFRKNNTLFTVLALGVLRSFWHLPLYVYGHISWFEIFIFVIAFQIIVAWLFKQSGGSLPAVMLFHFASNLIGATFSPVFTGMARMSYYALFMGIAVLIAIVIATYSRTFRTPLGSTGNHPVAEA
jgi:hypothetical protein